MEFVVNSTPELLTSSSKYLQDHKMIGFIALVAVLGCVQAAPQGAPAAAPKPIPGTERYVLPQILPGQNADDVLWALSMPAAAALARLRPTPAPAPAPAPIIPGQEKFVQPQILLGQAPGNVLWAATPVNSNVLWALPPAIPVAAPAPSAPTVYTAAEGKRLHNLRLNDPHWNTNQPIRAWEAAYNGAPAAAPALL